MKPDPFFIAYSVFIALTFVVGNYFIAKESAKISAALDEAERKAKDAKTVHELRDAWEMLLSTSQKCWHRSHGARLRAIEAIIRTKAEYIFS